MAVVRRLTKANLERFEENVPMNKLVWAKLQAVKIAVNAYAVRSTSWVFSINALFDPE